MSSSLFSVFEPTAWGGLPLNWLSMAAVLFLPSSYLLASHYISAALHSVSRASGEAVHEAFGKQGSPLSSLLLASLLAWLILNNFLGLGPYFFTASAHLVFGFSLALSLWGGYMVVYTVYFNESAMAHLIPSGTPLALVTLMIVIETVSSLIRPLTLMFRLTANMIAGHLLVTLLSGSLISSTPLVFLSAGGAMLALLLLETAVSFIQSYVFFLLSSLYLTDITGAEASARGQASAQNLL